MSRAIYCEKHGWYEAPNGPIVMGVPIFNSCPTCRGDKMVKFALIAIAFAVTGLFWKFPKYIGEKSDPKHKTRNLVIYWVWLFSSIILVFTGYYDVGLGIFSIPFVYGIYYHVPVKFIKKKSNRVNYWIILFMVSCAITSCLMDVVGVGNKDDNKDDDVISIEENTKEKCGDDWYDKSKQKCQNNIVQDKCGDNWYDKSKQKCENNVVQSKCGYHWYNTADGKLRCKNNVLEKICAGNWTKTDHDGNCVYN
jgi:hypothetical protein